MSRVLPQIDNYIQGGGIQQHVDYVYTYEEFTHEKADIWKTWIENNITNPNEKNVLTESLRIFGILQTSYKKNWDEKPPHDQPMHKLFVELNKTINLQYKWLKDNLQNQIKTPSLIKERCPIDPFNQLLLMIKIKGYNILPFKYLVNMFDPLKVNYTTGICKENKVIYYHPTMPKFISFVAPICKKNNIELKTLFYNYDISVLFTHIVDEWKTKLSPDMFDKKCKKPKIYNPKDFIDTEYETVYRCVDKYHVMWDVENFQKISETCCRILFRDDKIQSHFVSARYYWYEKPLFFLDFNPETPCVNVTNMKKYIGVFFNVALSKSLGTEFISFFYDLLDGILYMFDAKQLLRYDYFYNVKNATQRLLLIIQYVFNFPITKVISLKMETIQQKTSLKYFMFQIQVIRFGLLTQGSVNMEIPHLKPIIGPKAMEVNANQSIYRTMLGYLQNTSLLSLNINDIKDELVIPVTPENTIYINNEKPLFERFWTQICEQPDCYTLPEDMRDLLGLDKYKPATITKITLKITGMVKPPKTNIPETLYYNWMEYMKPTFSDIERDFAGSKHTLWYNVMYNIVAEMFIHSQKYELKTDEEITAKYLKSYDQINIDMFASGMVKFDNPISNELWVTMQTIVRNDQKLSSYEMTHLRELIDITTDGYNASAEEIHIEDPVYSDDDDVYESEESELQDNDYQSDNEKEDDAAAKFESSNTSTNPSIKKIKIPRNQTPSAPPQKKQELISGTQEETQEETQEDRKRKPRKNPPLNFISQLQNPIVTNQELQGKGRGVFGVFDKRKEEEEEEEEELGSTLPDIKQKQPTTNIELEKQKLNQTKNQKSSSSSNRNPVPGSKFTSMLNKPQSQLTSRSKNPTSITETQSTTNPAEPKPTSKRRPISEYSSD